MKKGKRMRREEEERQRKIGCKKEEIKGREEKGRQGKRKREPSKT